MPPCARLVLRLLLPAILVPCSVAFLGANAQSITIHVEPESLQLEVDETAQLSAIVRDNAGAPVEGGVLFFSQSPRALSVDSTGLVTAHRPGKYAIIVVRPANPEPTRLFVAVSVAFPPIDRIAFTKPTRRIYVGTTVHYQAMAYDASGFERPDQPLKVASNRPTVASIDQHWNLTAHEPGRVTLTSWTGDILSKLLVDVEPNPTAALEIPPTEGVARTGDVLRFTATALDAGSMVIHNMPVSYSVSAKPADPAHTTPTAVVTSDGRFVAEDPGLYTVTARSAAHAVTRSVKVVPRSVERKLDVVGRGRVNRVHTSDLWVWEGVDGRDYAVTGTWGGDGEALFWDVTDPAAIVKIATVRVDARTVNDVKVSEDGAVCVITREGASNRRNGIVILDCTDPHEPKIIAEYDDGLTGGVHNVFINDEHVYAVNNGRRIDVINIEKPDRPYRVGHYELDTPGHAVHDIVIQDGFAFTSNWGDGLHIVDVGGTLRDGWQASDSDILPFIDGDRGASPANPVRLASFEVAGGRTHAALPFPSQSANRFYVVTGDEWFPFGLDVNEPGRAAGYLHFIDFTDPGNPDESARYEVPEAGSHNFWIQGDTLFAAFYNGGLRVVDISGELLGDLYRQGREIASFQPFDPEGVVPNAPFTWGPMVHKGVIYFTDWNSGLWAVKLSDNSH